MKNIRLILVIVLLVSLFSNIGTINASANIQNDIKVSVNGNLLEFDVPPTIISGRTLVPLRGILEAIGIEPVWNEKTRTVTASNGNKTIVLPVDSKNVIVNNKSIELDVPAKIIAGRTLVPIRFMAESFGALVDWDNETRTVIIDSTLIEVDSGESGDPSSPILSLDESWDGVVNGIRTAMSYDSATGSFSGIVENTTNKMISSILIELNLKQGTKTVVELGPHSVGDLSPGEQATVELLVSDEPLAAGVVFDAWEIHPEAEGTGENGNETGGEQHGEGVSEGSESGGEGTEGIEGNEGASGLALNEIYDVVKTGARLILAYDEQSNSFIGSVENTTNNILTRARVEIHLSNGAELGPTTPVDIAPGKKINITLKATNNPFDSWTTHAEFGASERSEGSEGNEGSEGSENNEGSEGSESSGEHGSEGN